MKNFVPFYIFESFIIISWSMDRSFIEAQTSRTDKAKTARTDEAKTARNDEAQNARTDKA